MPATALCRRLIDKNASEMWPLAHQVKVAIFQHDARVNGVDLPFLRGLLFDHDLARARFAGTHASTRVTREHALEGWAVHGCCYHVGTAWRRGKATLFLSLSDPIVEVSRMRPLTCGNFLSSGLRNITGGPSNFPFPPV